MQTRNPVHKTLDTQDSEPYPPPIGALPPRPWSIAMIPNPILLSAALALILMLPSCGDRITRQAGFIAGDHEMELPVGIGPDPNELRESPCACIPIPLLVPPVPATSLTRTATNAV